MNSAEILFGDNGNFSFMGLNRSSGTPVHDFTVEGTWTHDGDEATFQVGSDVQTWDLEFEDDSARFTQPSTGETFELIRRLIQALIGAQRLGRDRWRPRGARNHAATLPLPRRSRYVIE